MGFLNSHQLLLLCPVSHIKKRPSLDCNSKNLGWVDLENSSCNPKERGSFSNSCFNQAGELQAKPYVTFSHLCQWSLNMIDLITSVVKRTAFYCFTTKCTLWSLVFIMPPLPFKIFCKILTASHFPFKQKSKIPQKPIYYYISLPKMSRFAQILLIPMCSSGVYTTLIVSLSKRVIRLRKKVGNTMSLKQTY